MYCKDEGSAFLQDMGNYLPRSTASSGNLNLQQHCCDTEIAVFTFVNIRRVAPRKNLIMHVLESVFVWNLGSLLQMVRRMEVVSGPAS